jgi:glycosyltransferase involved in cell wall biosynthesis
MEKILVLTRYDQIGSSSRVRFLNYIPHLRAAGFYVVIDPFFDDSYLEALYTGRSICIGEIARYYARRLGRLISDKKWSLIWLEKEALPWLPYWIESKLLKRIPYVLDLDDAWYLRYRTHRSPLVKRLLGTKLEDLVRAAAGVTVGNEYLAAWARKAGARSPRILPSSIDIDRYPPVPMPGSGKFIVGWIGTPITVRYLKVVDRALREFCRRPDVRLVLIGSGTYDIPGLQQTTFRWSSHTEVPQLSRIDVGIMPLTNTPWEHGKCGFKLIQYMGAWKPVVASPVGVNRSIVSDGVNGFLAQEESDWVEALTKLRDDPDLRARMGANGRKLVEEQYSTKIHAQALAHTLMGAIEASR